MTESEKHGHELALSVGKSLMEFLVDPEQRPNRRGQRLEKRVAGLNVGAAFDEEPDHVSVLARSAGSAYFTDTPIRECAARGFSPAILRVLLRDVTSETRGAVIGAG